MPRSEIPSPRLFRAGFIKADSLHAGLRAPEPTLSRGERVGPAPLYVLRPCLASAPPPPPPPLSAKSLPSGRGKHAPPPCLPGAGLRGRDGRLRVGPGAKGAWE